jgi:hypothetical protein
MPEFKYGDKVVVCSPGHKDFGKVGRVVENPTTTVPWVTLNEPAYEPFEMPDPPFGVANSDYSAAKTTCYTEADLELATTKKTMRADEVPVGVMFSVPDRGGKFLRIDPRHTRFPKSVVVLVVEALESVVASEPMTISHFDNDFEVVVELE